MSGGEEEAPSSSSSEAGILQRWKQIQHSLKQRLVINDDFTWRPPPSSELKYIGGVDVSCFKDDQSVACGTIVVLDFHTANVVYHDSAHVTLHVPYIAGFLAFREAPVLSQLLEKMKNDNSPYDPQLLMVDGNGMLHPRGFGLACHLGVLENIPSIGIGKNLHCIDGLTEKGVRKCLLDSERSGKDFMTLTGRSGCVHGVIRDLNCLFLLLQRLHKHFNVDK